jgi:membrane-associated phospholipid phosphatase
VNRIRGTAWLTSIAFAVSAANAQTPDTSAAKEPLFTKGDAWLAAGFVVGIAAAMPFDEKAAAWSQSPSVQTPSHASVASFFNVYGGEGVLIASVATYGVARIAGSRNFSELGLRATEAIAISGAITAVAKGVIGRQRPYVNIDDSHYYAFGKGFGNDAYASMPSGHTTAAFAFASSVTDETAHFWPKQTWWVATLTYGSAVMVGAARIYSNAHWTSDVIAGAFVGTFSGLGVNRWHRAHPNSKLDKWLLPKSVAPTKSGVAMTWSASF